MKNRLRRILGLGLTVGLVACASGQAEDSPFDRTTAPEASRVVEVWHNAPVAGSLTVYLVAASGQSQRLGSVGPSATETFSLGRISGGDYRLSAVTTDGRRVTSSVFSLFGRGGMRWDVDRNRLTPMQMATPD